MKCKDVLQILNCSRQTLCRYVKEGTIKATKKKNGYYDYDEDSVYAFIGLKKKKTNKKIISYSRVSTASQKSQLKEQTQRIYNSCIARGITLDEQFEDIKSGMNFDRKGFNKICQMIIKGEVQMLVIENRDRLMRFGFEGFEKIFKYFGCTILVLNDKIENKTYEQELPDPVLASIEIGRRGHEFSCQYIFARRQREKTVVLPDFEKVKHSIIQSLEELNVEVPGLKDWQELWSVVKKSKVKYRFPLLDRLSSSPFSRNYKQKRQIVYTF